MILPVADSKVGGGGAPLLLAHILKKQLFSVYKAYISLCAFAINEDEADKYVFHPPRFSKFLDPSVDFTVFHVTTRIILRYNRLIFLL